MAKAKAKRPWSTDFTPRGAEGDRTVHINISNVPPTLRSKFQAKCKREGKSQRNLVLGWIRNWVEDRRPDQDGPRGNSRTVGVASRHESV